ncbi:uncharacterized protein [Primulina huaijiensis]|uniref:uncharacterized protein n=1 Tax=Primulina huaijiensis TaxID=1492673 RepID=UPI003CC79C16
MKEVMLFGKKGKLSSSFIRPFEILEKVEALVYKVALPPNLPGIHNVFHISMLRKYVSNLSHVLNYEPLQLTPNMTYEEKSTHILGRQERMLRKKMIKMVEGEATWETKNNMRSRYLGLFCE